MSRYYQRGDFWQSLESLHEKKSVHTHKAKEGIFRQLSSHALKSVSHGYICKLTARCVLCAFEDGLNHKGMSRLWLQGQTVSAHLLLLHRLTQYICIAYIYYCMVQVTLPPSTTHKLQCTTSLWHSLSLDEFINSACYINNIFLLSESILA